MKKYIQFSILCMSLITLSLTSCSKKFSTGIIHRDCTGTYLELNEKDYMICNSDITNGYADESEVEVKFKSISNCTSNSVGFSCEMYHQHFGSIEITQIK